MLGHAGLVVISLGHAGLVVVSLGHAGLVVVSIKVRAQSLMVEKLGHNP